VRGGERREMVKWIERVAGGLGCVEWWWVWVDRWESRGIVRSTCFCVSYVWCLGMVVVIDGW
jgi:hypothetical protein